MDPNPTNNVDGDGGVVIQDPTVDHRANKSGPSTELVAVGSAYEYRISSTNIGNAGFFGTLVMDDVIPFGQTLNSIDENGWTCTPAPVVVGPTTIHCELVYTEAMPLGAGQTSPVVTTTVLVTEEGALPEHADRQRRKRKYRGH